MAGVERFSTWARENSRVLITTAVVLTLLVAGAIYYNSVKRGVESEAAIRFSNLQGTLASGNTQLAIRDLQEFLAGFGDTRTGEQARLVLAELLLSEDRPQEALETLQELDTNPARPQGLAAAQLIAAAYEAAGETGQAVDTYLEIADRARFDFERREALADAARVTLQGGDPGAAAALYEDVLDTFEEGEQGRGYYEMWLAEARARAGEGPADLGNGADAPQQN
ncbi:MAG TPA: tetratricopeptide repeat protein [Longimicrobiales bacterium]|nr:tetratricopeptide repeat protein [Longimicrobiales bacterium]